MAESQIVQIRKKGGIDNIRVDKAGKVHAELYYQKFKNPNEDGTPMGAYREGMLLDAKHFLSPQWNTMKRRWTWGGSDEALLRLIKKLKLKYSDDHAKAGSVIEPGKAEERLTDFNDPVFRHDKFYGARYLQDSRGSLNFQDPLEEFLFLCYKGNPSVIDKSEGDKVVSKYASGAKYEIISPKAESKKRVQSTLREVEAKRFIGKLYGDDAKVRAICEAMDLGTYRPQVDSEAAWLLLDEASQNTSKLTKYGGKTQQDMFIECCKMDDEDLATYQKIVQARKRGHLRKYSNYYVFDGEKIHVKNHNSLVRYFKDPKNQEVLIKLLDLLDADDK